MNATTLGLRRGWTEQLNLWSDRRELLNALLGTVGTYAVLILFIGGNNVPGTPVSMAAFMTPGFPAFAVFSTGLMALPMLIAADREDGTLMRAPHAARGRARLRDRQGGHDAADDRAERRVRPAGGHAARRGGRAGDARAVVHARLGLVLGTLAVVPLGAAGVPPLWPCSSACSPCGGRTCCCRRWSPAGGCPTRRRTTSPATLRTAEPASPEPAGSAPSGRRTTAAWPRRDRPPRGGGSPGRW